MLPSRGKVRQLIQHILPGVVRPLRVLWNEIIGFFFLALAAWAVLSTVRRVREFQSGSGSFHLIVVAGLFDALMIWFGVTSFLRARRISRS